MSDTEQAQPVSPPHEREDVVHQKPRSSSRSPSRSSPPRNDYRSSKKTSPRIMVQSFPAYVTEDQIKEIFSAYGRVFRVELDISRRVPTAFITYDSIESAEDAIASMHRGDIDGKIIDVHVIRTSIPFERLPPIPKPRYQQSGGGGGWNDSRRRDYNNSWHSPSTR